MAKQIQLFLGDYGNQLQTDLEGSIEIKDYIGYMKIDEDTNIPCLVFSDSSMSIDDYIYRYENAQGEVVENFEEFDSNTMNNFNEYNIAPYSAACIGVYKKDTDYRVGSISLAKFKPPYPPRLYRVGLVSDVHYNDTDLDYNTSDDHSYYNYDLKNAMELFFMKEEVAMMCAAGDISNEWQQNSLVTFKQFWNDFYKGKPFFTCKGNHDNGYDYHYLLNNGSDNTDPSTSIWHKYTFPLNLSNESITDIEYCPSDCSSFCFDYDLGNGKKDLYIFLSVDYGSFTTVANKKLSPNDGGIGNVQFYAPETLEWFSNKMEENIDRRSFVFTHQFFWQKAGNNNNPNKSYRYAQESSRVADGFAYCLYARQFELLNELNNKCKKSIWFTGHSHYKWAMQRFDPYVKVCCKDFFITSRDQSWPFTERCTSGGNVSLPSLARPLVDKENIQYYSVDYNASESAIMDVYEDFIEIRGIKSTFKTIDALTKEVYLTSSHFAWDGQNDWTLGDDLLVNDLDDDYVEFVFDGRNKSTMPRGIFNASIGENQDRMSSDSSVKIEYFKVYDYYGNDITEEIAPNVFVGFRSNSYAYAYNNGNNALYYSNNDDLKNNIYFVNDKFVFGISSCYSGNAERVPNGDYPYYTTRNYIRILMKVKGIGSLLADSVEIDSTTYKDFATQVDAIPTKTSLSVTDNYIYVVTPKGVSITASNDNYSDLTVEFSRTPLQDAIIYKSTEKVNGNFTIYAKNTKYALIPKYWYAGCGNTSEVKVYSNKYVPIGTYRINIAAS